MESRSGSAPAPRAATKGRGSSARESSYAAPAITTSSTAIMAHLPMAMLASAIGASTRAVAALHRSTGTLDAAPAPGAGPERLQSLQELLGGEVGPQRFRHVELGVGYLPEQEVRDAQLAAGPDQQVDLGYVGGVEVTGERHLVDVLRRETVCDYPPGGVHDLRASSIVERDVDVEAVVTRGEDLSLDVYIALDYGGRAEIVDATRRIVADGLSPEDIDEMTFARYLYAPDVPEVDLVIRTSGELRVSNFLLWQIAYAEFYVTETLWPDFSPKEFLRALESFGSRSRRRGGV